MSTDETKDGPVAVTTDNISKRGVRYPAGTPVDLLPEDVRAGLTEMTMRTLEPEPESKTEEKPRRGRKPADG